MCGHLGDLVSEAREVFKVLEVGLLAGTGKCGDWLKWLGAYHGGIPYFIYCIIIQF
jgi:hypothetical protein